jgi:hypothetical protein
MDKLQINENGELRDMNEAEIAQYETDLISNGILKEMDSKKAANKAAIAERLGLSPEELAALLT